MSFDLELCYLVGAGLGWRLANDDWDAGRQRERREELLAELAAWAPPKRRERRPSLESQLKQLWKAARAAGVRSLHDRGPRRRQADGVAGGASRRLRPALDEAPGRSLFTTRTIPKQKVVF